MSENEPKKLFRSLNDRWISGVCGGFAQYFNIDSTLMRILWVVFTLTGGFGLILYISALIIIPLEPSGIQSAPDKKKADSRFYWGIFLLILGIAFLLHSLHWRYWIWRGVDFWGFVIPLIIIIIGIFMIIRPGRAVTDSAQPEISSSGATTGTGSQDRSGRRLYRSRSRVILGVAGGTAEYFKIDPGLCRLLWILFILITGGIGLLVYIALAFALPESGSDNFSKEK